jgi:hypothetical protein
MDHLLDFSVSSIRDSVGVPLELLGMAEKDQPGVLEAQRVRSSLTLLSVLFDSLRAYRKQHGRADGRIHPQVHVRWPTDPDDRGSGARSTCQLMRDPQTMEYDIRLTRRRPRAT